MALPIIVTPAVPQPPDSPGNAPAIFNALWTLFLDIFGMPANTPITGNLMTLGVNTDGKLATLPVTKAMNPFLRLIGTEVLASDIRVIETGGLVALQLNTGTESAPTWVTIWSFQLGGRTQVAAFVHANTSGRTYTLPDNSGTVALLSDIFPFPSGTKMPFIQATAPVGWTRVVDAANTDTVLRLVQNSEVPGVGGSWTITGLTVVVGAHTHDVPLHSDGAGTRFYGAPPFGVGGASSNPLTNPGGPSGAVAGNFMKSQSTDLGTIAPASNATWRPKYVDAIVASKN